MTNQEALDGIKKALAKYLSEKTGISEEKHFEYLQYDTEIDIIQSALAELSAIKQRAEEYAKDYQLTSEEIYCINYIIKGEGK